MKRAKRLGRRYIRTLSDALSAAFRNPRFQARIFANITKNNILFNELKGRPSLTGKQHSLPGA